MLLKNNKIHFFMLILDRIKIALKKIAKIASNITKKGPHASHPPLKYTKKTPKNFKGRLTG
jgi:hypothetical protein